MEFPEKVGSECYEEDDEGVFVLGGGSEGEVDANMPEAAGDGEAVSLDVGGGGE